MAFTAKLHGVWIGAVLLIGLTPVLMSYPRGWVVGELRSTGSPHGDFVVKPVTCVLGGHWGFDGVWVVTETLEIGERRGFRGGLKILNGEDRWEAIVEKPTGCERFTCPQWRVDPRHCRVFDVVVEPRSLWLRRKGHATLECEFPEGGTLTAKLLFERCGAVPTWGGNGD